MAVIYLNGQMWLTFPLDSYTNVMYSPIHDIINKNKSMLRVAVDVFREFLFCSNKFYIAEGLCTSSAGYKF
jgi:hypothetical protein